MEEVLHSSVRTDVGYISLTPPPWAAMEPNPYSVSVGLTQKANTAFPHTRPLSNGVAICESAIPTIPSYLQPASSAGLLISARATAEIRVTGLETNGLFTTAQGA